MGVQISADLVRKLAPEERAAFLGSLSEAEIEALRTVWEFWARPDQLLPPGRWSTALYMSGRGWGKTRCGSEAVRHWVDSGVMKVGLVGQTSADIRDVIVEGPSGIISVFPDHQKPLYEPTKRRLTFHTGATATTFSADCPDTLRGFQAEKFWLDEFAKFDRPDELWDQVQLSLRMGDSPQCIITTTPRPMQLLREIRDDETTVTTLGSTFANVDNLAPQFAQRIQKLYGGTHLARQEIAGELLSETRDSIVSMKALDALRRSTPPDLERVVVGVDPATTNRRSSDLTGIVVCGKDRDGRLIVLEDRSVKAGPDEWARRVVETFHRWDATKVVVESNQGGDMVSSVIRNVDDSCCPVKKIHQRYSKGVRAEPILNFFERGEARIIGRWNFLERELAGFTPNGYQGDGSPDRADALVNAATDLMLGASCTWGAVAKANAARDSEAHWRGASGWA